MNKQYTEKVAKVAEEYFNDPNSTYRSLATKYDVSRTWVQLAVIRHFTPEELKKKNKETLKINMIDPLSPKNAKIHQNYQKRCLKNNVNERIDLISEKYNESNKIKRLTKMQLASELKIEAEQMLLDTIQLVDLKIKEAEQIKINLNIKMTKVKAGSTDPDMESRVDYLWKLKETVEKSCKIARDRLKN